MKPIIILATAATLSSAIPFWEPPTFSDLASYTHPQSPTEDVSAQPTEASSTSSSSIVAIPTVGPEPDVEEAVVPSAQKFSNDDERTAAVSKAVSKAVSEAVSEAISSQVFDPMPFDDFVRMYLLSSSGPFFSPPSVVKRGESGNLETSSMSVIDLVPVVTTIWGSGPFSFLILSLAAEGKEDELNELLRDPDVWTDEAVANWAALTGVQDIDDDLDGVDAETESLAKRSFDDDEISVSEVFEILEDYFRAYPTQARALQKRGEPHLVGLIGAEEDDEHAQAVWDVYVKIFGAEVMKKVAELQDAMIVQLSKDDDGGNVVEEEMGYDIFKTVVEMTSEEEEAPEEALETAQESEVQG